tara:strand:+ start:56 stop:550 length:495 start_codon:yes stop_codon:yes gene_type:complete
MIKSPFLFLPKELLKYILDYLDISDIINLKKLHPFTEIQQELSRSLNIKLNKERKYLDDTQKNYIKETLYFATKDIKPIDLPDPFYIQNIFKARDNQIQTVILQIDYSINLERLLYDRKKFDKEFNDFYEPVLRFYKEERCNTFPTHPINIAMFLEGYNVNINK